MMERYWLNMVRQHNEAMRDEIMRHRLAIALRANHVNAWRRLFGRVLVRIGRALEGENRIDFGQRSELRFDHE